MIYSPAYDQETNSIIETLNVILAKMVTKDDLEQVRVELRAEMHYGFALDPRRDARYPLRNPRNYVRLDAIEAELKDHRGYAKEIDHLMERVRAIEKHLGLIARSPLEPYDAANPLRRASGLHTGSNAVLLNRELSAGSRLAYALLLQRAWSKGAVPATEAALAEDMKSKETEVRRYLEELKAADLLDIDQQGTGLSARYRKYVINGYKT